MTKPTTDALEWTTARAPGARNAPPAAYIQAQRSDSPLRRVKIWDGSEPWLITTYKEYRALLLDPRVSADKSRAGFPLKNPGYVSKKKTFLTMDDPEHMPFRRLFAKNLSAPKMEKLRPKIQQLVDEKIDAMLAGPKPVDFIEAFALSIPIEILGELFGVPHEDRGRFLALSIAMSSAESTPEEAAEAISELNVYAERLIRARLDKPTDDFISALVVEGYNTGLFTWDDLLAEVTLLIGATHDTSLSLISLGTLALLNYPDQLQLLIENSDDPKFVANATEELVRYVAPTQTGRRRIALEDIEIGGEVIKAGDGIIGLDNVTSRDPAVFPSPDVLDLTRAEARRHNAYGYGTHQCAGQSLARVELQVVFGTLFKRIPTLKLAVEEESLPFREDTIIYIVDSMPVTW